MDTFDDSDLQAVEREDSVCAGPKGKATGESTGLKEKPDVSGKKKRRRGPPRPHRQVPDDVLTQRLSKLQARIEKAPSSLWMLQGTLTAIRARSRIGRVKRQRWSDGVDISCE